jgi:hypothetical protein
MQFDRLAWTKLRGRCAPNSALVYSLKQAHKSHPFRNARRIERQLRLLRHLHSAAQSASPRFLARSRSRRGVTVGCAIAARAGRQSQRIGAQCRRSARREIPVESEDRSCPCPLQARGQTPEERGGPIHLRNTTALCGLTQLGIQFRRNQDLKAMTHMLKLTCAPISRRVDPGSSLLVGLAHCAFNCLADYSCLMV